MDSAVAKLQSQTHLILQRGLCIARTEYIALYWNITQFTLLYKYGTSNPMVELH